MRFKMNKSVFVAGLFRPAMIAANAKSTFAILNNVKIDADSGCNTVSFIGTNLVLSVVGQYRCEVMERGSVTVPGKTFYDIVKNMPDGDIEIESHDNDISIINGNSKFRVPTLPVFDFPEINQDIDDIKFFDMDAPVLLDMINHTFFAVSTEEQKSHLNGSMLISKGDDRLTMIGTDGHRLAKIETSINNSIEFQCIIPYHTMGEIKHMVDNDAVFSIGMKDNKIIVKKCISAHGEVLNTVILMSQLIGDEIIPYEQVIPRNCENSIVFDRQVLVDSLRRVMVVADSDTNVMHMTFSDGYLTLESRSNIKGQGHEKVPIDYNGEIIKIGICSKYVLDVLLADKNKELTMEIDGDLNPVVIRNEDDFLCVIMPMRIKD